MSSYSFENLSPIDFEELCRDLMQKKLQLYFESFTDGIDGGIDFRAHTSDNKILILQCKRFTGRNFSTLKSALIKESKKLNTLKPDRYVLMTSFGLTPSQKDKILKIFSPYMLRVDDIFGRNEINNLLGEYEEIERKHFKLWLHSSNILERFIHKDTLNRSHAKFEEIKEKSNVYVLNESFNKAVAILNQSNYCIIAGNPGVGKSTLADILSFVYMQEEFEFNFISQNISKAWEVFEEAKNQIFYFDDFLGENFLMDGLEKNEISDLLLFVKKVQNSKNKKLILTTREYILNQAKDRYEKLKNSGFEFAKCTVDMGDYSKTIKAKILYNHMYYSKLQEAYYLNIIQNKTYKKIISHKHYNPRFIQFLTNAEKLKSENIVATKYSEYFLKMLDNPEEIWEGAFVRITRSAKYLLYVLVLAYDEIFVNDLKMAFQKVYESEANCKHYEIDIYDFEKALKELEGNFIKIEHDGKNHIVTFQNPSIKDFLIQVIEKDRLLVNMLINNIVFFDHLYNLFSIKKLQKFNLKLDWAPNIHILNKVVLTDSQIDLFEEASIKTFDLNSARLIKYSNYNYYQYNHVSLIAKLDIVYNFFLQKKDGSVYEFIVSEFNRLSAQTLHEVDNIDRLKFVNLLVSLGFDDSSKIIYVFEYFKGFLYAPEDLECIQILNEAFPEFNTYFLEYRNDFVKALRDYIYAEAEHIDQHNDGADTIGELKKINEIFSLNLDYSSIEEKVDELIEYQEFRTDMKLDEWKFDKMYHHNEDDIIDVMFKSLENMDIK